MTNPDQPYYPPGGSPPEPSDSYPPVDYPEYPPAYLPPYPSGPARAPGSPPPGYGYPDPYRRPRPSGTNSLATASLVTSVLGIPLGVPLTLLCSLGALIPIIGIVLGIAALSQIRQTGQGGHKLAVGGIVVGAVVLVLLAVLFMAFSALVINRVP